MALIVVNFMMRSLAGQTHWYPAVIYRDILDNKKTNTNYILLKSREITIRWIRGVIELHIAQVIGLKEKFYCHYKKKLKRRVRKSK